MRLHQPQKDRLDFKVFADMAVKLIAKIQTY